MWDDSAVAEEPLSEIGAWFQAHTNSDFSYWYFLEWYVVRFRDCHALIVGLFDHGASSKWGRLLG
jgi:hypothetical protein